MCNLQPRLNAFLSEHLWLEMEEDNTEWVEWPLEGPVQDGSGPVEAIEDGSAPSTGVVRPTRAARGSSSAARPGYLLLSSLPDPMPPGLAALLNYLPADHPDNPLNAARSSARPARLQAKPKTKGIPMVRSVSGHWIPKISSDRIPKAWLKHRMGKVLPKKKKQIIPKDVDIWPCLHRMSELSKLIQCLEDVEMRDLLPESTQAAMTSLTWAVAQFLTAVTETPSMET